MPLLESGQQQRQTVQLQCLAPPAGLCFLTISAKVHLNWPRRLHSASYTSRSDPPLCLLTQWPHVKFPLWPPTGSKHTFLPHILSACAHNAQGLRTRSLLTCIRTEQNIHPSPDTHTHIHSHTNTCTHVYTQTPKHTKTIHIHTYTHMHIHTETYTYTQIPNSSA